MKLKFSILQILYWCGQGAFIGYLVPLLSNKGLNSASIGTIMALYTFTGFFGQVFFGYLCDRLRSIKRIYLFLNIIVIILYLFIYRANQSAAFPYTVLLGFFQLPMPVLLDAWVIKYYAKEPECFGPIRSWASFALAIFSFLFGFIVESAGFIALPIASIALYSSAIIIIYFTADCKGSLIRAKIMDSLKTLLHHKRFVWMSLSSIFLGMSAGSVVQMLFYIVYDAGGDKGDIGMATAIAACVEVPIMFFYPKLRSISISYKLILAISFYTLCFITMYFMNTMSMILVAMGFYGAGYGLFLPAMREFISKSVEQKIQTSALSLMDAAQNCIGTSLGVFLAGKILVFWSVKEMVLVFFICSLLSIIISYFTLTSQRIHL